MQTTEQSLCLNCDLENKCPLDCGMIEITIKCILYVPKQGIIIEVT